MDHRYVTHDDNDENNKNRLKRRVWRVVWAIRKFFFFSHVYYILTAIYRYLYYFKEQGRPK